MKKLVVGFLALWVLCMACAVSKSKIVYVFPEAMPVAVKEGYTKQCDKGQALYAITCGKCHNITVKGKEVIPDFTPEQLIGYELRVLNPKHESNIPETVVTADELGMIMTFLTYKNKTHVPVRKPVM
ncbi:MAG: hypothetical protein JWQ38_32 [Flavipsychrobacter sp.]|nr:hypothetical protein [Flavipsychrobacter sp.]